MIVDANSVDNNTDISKTGINLIYRWSPCCEFPHRLKDDLMNIKAFLRKTLPTSVLAPS
jgi:hypothetical protein